jgi:hypothetical protein
MRRLLLSIGLAVCATALAPSPAHAQQAFSFYIGAFGPRAEDARDPNDVLVNDTSFLDFNINNFRSVTVGGEWLVRLSDKTEAGLGVGFYQHTEPAVDAFSVFDTTGNPIEADLKLRIVPFSATLRFLPMGHGGPIEPYVGAGVGVFAWRYSETGDFVASDGATIVHGSFSGSGAQAGPVILGGVRFPFGGGGGSIGGEIRYQSAVATLPSDQGFAGSKIDLGGFNYLLTLNIGF